MPILIIPVVSSLVVGFVMFRVVGAPIRDIMRRSLALSRGAHPDIFGLLSQLI